jgi:hypothetical protein
MAMVTHAAGSAAAVLAAAAAGFTAGSAEVLGGGGLGSAVDVDRRADMSEVETEASREVQRPRLSGPGSFTAPGRVYRPIVPPRLRLCRSTDCAATPTSGPARRRAARGSSPSRPSSRPPNPFAIRYYSPNVNDSSQQCLARPRPRRSATAA